MATFSTVKEEPKLVACQQQELVTCIFDERLESHKFNSLGIEIYRNNLRATAAKALSITFPTVRQLIGEPLFVDVAEKLLKQEPPIDGDWAMWGEEFYEVLKQTEQLEGYPYVSDCACLDYAIHQIERARDSIFNNNSLGLLVDVELDNLYVEVPDSVIVLETDYPIIELWNVHHSEMPEHYTKIINDKVKNDDLRQYTIVSRPHYKAQLQELTSAEYRWMLHLKQGRSIGHALEMLGSVEFKFDQWLPHAIRHNYISRLFQ